MKPGLVIDARIGEAVGGLVMVLDDALFVVLPAVAEVPGLSGFVPVPDDSLFVVLPAVAEVPGLRGFEQAAPWVASARFWMPKASFGQSVGWGNVRESTVVYATLKFETNLDQFRTLPCLFGFALLTSVLMDALIMEAVFVMRSLLLFTLSVIHVE